MSSQFSQSPSSSMFVGEDQTKTTYECPCCGYRQTVEMAGLINCTWRMNGWLRRTVLRALMERPRTMDQLIMLAYSDREEPTNADRNIRVVISRMRSEDLAPLGWTIKFLPHGDEVGAYHLVPMVDVSGEV